jgi:UDP-N-acetylglucosamine 2-epimerase (non-hydrolysing)
MHPVCFVVGARPNFMKVAPVYNALRDLDSRLELLLVHTGQHYDEEMSEVFLKELTLPPPDVFLGIGSGSHAKQTAKALVGVEDVLQEREAALCVVAGDVNSTLAAALAASKLQIPVAHIEAGLRSFDETMPEEANRRLTDHLSRLLFAHSDSAVENLRREGVDASQVHLVGNTMIDSVFAHLPVALAREPWKSFEVHEGGFALVTLHRPALVDHEDRLRGVAEALVTLADDLPVIFPVHPRTQARLDGIGFSRDSLGSTAFHVCAPLGYLDFLALEAKARFVLTDSGGVQEETSALAVPCFTLRDTTERPITTELGTNTLLGADPTKIRSIPHLLEGRTRPTAQIPLWDGRAGLRTARLISSFLA